MLTENQGYLKHEFSEESAGRFTKERLDINSFFFNLPIHCVEDLPTNPLHGEIYCRHLGTEISCRFLVIII